MSLSAGDVMPTITLPASGGGSLSLPADYAGRKLVLYFYPKDNTPGCTLEGQDFARLHAEFLAAGAEIVGISKDSVKSHDNFCSKFGFPFRLLADTEGLACEAFGVMVEKSMYGKKYVGIDRRTFLFDEEGRVLQVWPKVKVAGHADEVLAAVRQS